METVRAEPEKPGLTTRTAIIAIITVVVAYFSIRFTKYNNAGFGLIPVWWGVLFFFTVWVAPKISPKLKLSLQESMFMMIVIWVSTYTASSGWNPEYNGYSFWVNGNGKMGYFRMFYELTNSPYKEAYTNWIPSFWAPKDTNVLNTALTGGPLDWGAWATPVLYWMLMFGIVYTVQYLWGLFIRKPLVEVERLSFPSFMTPRYLVNYVYMEDETTKRPTLLSRRHTLTKVFWAFFIVGIITRLPDFLVNFLPSVTPFFAFYEFHWELYTKDIFPGAEFFNGFMTGSLPGFLLLPVNTLMTFMWTGILLHLVYPTLGIRMGFLPYEPGSEVQYGLSTYGTLTGPFKHIFWAQEGVILGLGVWIIFTHRKHIINIFKAGFGNKEVPQGEGGISYRTLVYATLGLSALAIILLTVSGMPAPVSIFWMPLAVIGGYGLIRYQSESADWTPTMNYVFNWPLYDFGQALGYWGSVPANNEAAYRTMTLSYFGTTDHTGMVWVPSGVFPGYSGGIRARDSFIAIMIGIMGSAIVTLAFDIQFAHIWGLSSPTFQPQMAGGALASNTYGFVTSGAPEPFVPDPLERYWLMISGAIFAGAMGFLHVKLPWIPWSPAGFLLTIWWAWYWLAVLLALIIKVILLQVGGAKAHDLVLMPAVTGFIAGAGTSWFLAQVTLFSMRTLPGLMAG